MSQQAPEPWLRGPMEGIHPLVMPVFFTFAQVREELAAHTAGLSAEQVWRRPGGVAPLGFHVKHIAGSVDRLTTCAVGGQVDDSQMQFRGQEGQGSEGIQDLLRLLDEYLGRSEEQLRQIDPERLYDARAVGRKSLPTTVIGLIVHLAEHTQRHLGQAITTIKLLRNTG